MAGASDREKKERGKQSPHRELVLPSGTYPKSLKRRRKKGRVEKKKSSEVLATANTSCPGRRGNQAGKGSKMGLEKARRTSQRGGTDPSLQSGISDLVRAL